MARPPFDNLVVVGSRLCLKGTYAALKCYVASFSDATDARLVSRGSDLAPRRGSRLAMFGLQGGDPGCEFVQLPHAGQRAYRGDQSRRAAPTSPASAAVVNCLMMAGTCSAMAARIAATSPVP